MLIIDFFILLAKPFSLQFSCWIRQYTKGNLKSKPQMSKMSSLGLLFSRIIFWVLKKHLFFHFWACSIATKASPREIWSSFFFNKLFISLALSCYLRQEMNHRLLFLLFGILGASCDRGTFSFSWKSIFFSYFELTFTVSLSFIVPLW